MSFQAYLDNIPAALLLLSPPIPKMMARCFFMGL
jgi:hypothetical protein